MSLPNSNMWFIVINTTEEVTDFSNWMQGKLRRFNDSMEFQEWLASYTAFPLEFYLDGIHYKFKDRNELAFFSYGFEAALKVKFKF